MTIGYQAYQPAYRPAPLAVPRWAAPRVPGLPAATLPSATQVATVVRERPMLLGAVFSAGFGVVLLGWALVMPGASPATAVPADSGPAPVVVPAAVAPAPAAPPAPAPAAPAPVPAPAPAPPAPVVPAPAPVPEIITFDFDTGGSTAGSGTDSGGSVGCFPFQPC